MNIDSPIVSQTLFHPRREPLDHLSGGIPTQTECDGAVVCGYLHENRTTDCLLVLFHGNGEVAADYESLAAIFTGTGASFWVVDYRGYGRSTGAPSFSHMLRDAETILDDLPRIAQARGRPFRHVLLMGRSLGSASAIHGVCERGDCVNGLILDSPFADGLALIQRLGGPSLERAEMPGLEDNVVKISKCALPTLIIHGTNDRIIPISDAEALHAACPSVHKRLLRVQGAGHNDLLAVGFQEYCHALEEFVMHIAGP